MRDHRRVSVLPCEVDSLYGLRERTYLVDLYEDRVRGALGGVMVPKFVMPPFMRELADISPMSWGLEGFLDRRNLPVDVISRPYGGTVLCCAVAINDAGEAFNEHIALLNRSLQAVAVPSSRNHEKEH